MKKLVFLYSFMTIGYFAETYPQLSENTGASYTGWSEMNQLSGINNILNHPGQPFIDEINNFILRNALEENTNQELKTLKSSYPGDGGYLDTRMILDSTALYYSPGPAAEELKVAGSVYAYDARLNTIEEINYTRDSTMGNIMKKEHRYVYDYDADGNQTEWASYSWDSETSEWAGCWQNVYIYNAGGFPVVLITYDWDKKTKSWCNGWLKVEYAFNANGELAEKITYEWNSEKNDRIKNERYNYKYNTKGNLVADTCYRWDSTTESWEGQYCFAYEYNYQANLRSKFGKSLDSKSNKWVNTSLEIYAYDGSGNMIYKTFSDWNSVKSNWRKRYYYDYKYNNNGNLVEQTRKYQDTLTFVIKADERNVFEYDASGNNTKKTKYYWKNEINNWEETEKLVSSWSYPLLNNQSFHINEKCTGCSLLGNIITGSTYNREKIRFNLIQGDKENLFVLDTVTGNIFLTDPGDLDYETDSIYNLTVEAHFKDSTIFLNQKAKITICVNNINDNEPVVNDTTFNVNDNSDPGTVVGIVRATDDDGDLNPLTYSIISGNENQTFLIDKFSGTITINSGKIIDHKNQDVYVLTVQVSDNTFTDDATITVNITDVVGTSSASFNPTSLIKFYPNPATDILYLEIPDNTGKEFEIELINLSGQVIFSQSEFTEQIDVTQFQTGIYFVKVRVENNEILAGKVMINPNY